MSSLASVQALPPSEAVIERVANCEGVDPTELPVLYDVINPDALDALAWGADQRASGLEIEFTYHGYQVTVTGEGVVHIDEAGTRF